MMVRPPYDCLMTRGIPAGAGRGALRGCAAAAAVGPPAPPLPGRGGGRALETVASLCLGRAKKGGVRKTTVYIFHRFPSIYITTS